MPLQTLDPDTATFRTWLERTNTIIELLNSNTVVASANATGQFAIGSATDLDSSLTIGANKLFVNGSLLSINVTTAVTSNVTVSGIVTLAGANVFIQPSNTTRIGSSLLDVTANTTLSGRSTFSNTVEFSGATTRVTAGQFAVTSSTPAVFNEVTVTTATITNLTLSGPISLTSTLGVTGATTLNNTLTVNGSATLRNTLSVNGASTFSNTLTVTGSVTTVNSANITSSLIVNGTTTLFGVLDVKGSATFRYVVATEGFSGNGAALSSLNATAIATGTVPTARLGSGSASGSTFLAGDGTWKTPTVTSSIPVGTILMTVAAVASDSDWRICEGQPLLRADFSALSTLVGVPGAYGGNTTHLLLPDLRQRFPLGANTLSGVATNRGATGGSFNHTHTYTQVPAHTHTITDPTHNHASGNFNTNNAAAGSEIKALSGNANTGDRATGITVNSTGVASPQTESANPPYIVINYQIKVR